MPALYVTLVFCGSPDFSISAFTTAAVGTVPFLMLIAPGDVRGAFDGHVFFHFHLRQPIVSAREASSGIVPGAIAPVNDFCGRVVSVRKYYHCASAPQPRPFSPSPSDGEKGALVWRRCAEFFGLLLALSVEASTSRRRVSQKSCPAQRCSAIAIRRASDREAKASLLSTTPKIKNPAERVLPSPRREKSETVPAKRKTPPFFPMGRRAGVEGHRASQSESHPSSAIRTRLAPPPHVDRR